MKRLLPSIALLFVAALVPGCPIYDNGNKQCFNDNECAPGRVCDFSSGDCIRSGDRSCSVPSDCGSNRTCSRAGRCEVGDCKWPSIGCVAGYICAAPEGKWQCVADNGAGGMSAEAGAGGGTDVGASAGASDAGASNGGASAAGGSESTEAGSGGAI